MTDFVDSKDGAHVFAVRLVDEQNRVLGMLDRDKYSPTYGSLDRVYWAWKFTDFPGARFQEGICYLAYMFTTKLDGNLLYLNESVHNWIQGAFGNWSKIQRKAGDFDEAYPGERSLAATAFTGFYLSEAFRMLEQHLESDVADHFKESLTRAAEWLSRNDESHGFLSNHLAAAGATLLHAHQLLGEERFYERYRHFLEKILACQSKEGWYNEYGGADPGYQTHGMFYLARCWELTDDMELAESLFRACEFLKHFVHPDRSLGGEYASRNTQTYYPAAFELLAANDGSASWIATEMRQSAQDGSAAGFKSVDAYNYFPLLNNYVFATRAIRRHGDALAKATPPPTEPHTLHFDEAGLLKLREHRYDLIVASSKGGVIKVFDRAKRTLVYSSCGYIGRDIRGRLFSNQVFDNSINMSVSESEISLDARFFGYTRPVMTPIKFLAFRIFSLTTGRFSTVASWLKQLLVKVLIYRRTGIDIALKRSIRLGRNTVEVVDRISGDDLDRLISLEHRSSFTTIHMGSSRYFVPNELEVPGAIETRDPRHESVGDEISFRSGVDFAKPGE